LTKKICYKDEQTFIMQIKVQKSFVFRLRETAADARAFSRSGGSCRFVWNKALALQTRYYRICKKHLSYVKLANHLVKRWKKRNPWLNDAPSQALQQALKDLDNAWSRFFSEPDRVGRPQFKSKHNRTPTFRLPQGCELDAVNQRLRLPKTGWVRMRMSCEVEGAIKNVTVSRKPTGWYVSIQTEFEQDVEPRVGAAIGIDVGATVSVATSNGALEHTPARLEKLRARVVKLNRALARKKRGSKRRLKTKHKLSRVHHRIATCRREWQHQLTTSLCLENAIVCLEDLKVAVMTATEAKEKKRAIGSHTTEKLLSSGPAELRRQITYKQLWTGGQAVAVDPAYTSQDCAACSYRDKASRNGIKFACTWCGHENHADINAAQNILKRGLALLAAGQVANGREHGERVSRTPNRLPPRPSRRPPHDGVGILGL
jgi:putative transposase